MDEITKLMDQLIELSEQRTTHMKRIDIILKKYKSTLEAHGKYVLDVVPFLKPDVAKELLSDLQELGEIVVELGEGVEIFAEDWKKQIALDLQLIDEVDKKA